MRFRAAALVLLIEDVWWCVGGLGSTMGSPKRVARPASARAAAQRSSLRSAAVERPPRRCRRSPSRGVAAEPAPSQVWCGRRAAERNRVGH